MDTEAGVFVVEVRVFGVTTVAEVAQNEVTETHDGDWRTPGKKRKKLSRKQRKEMKRMRKLRLKGLARGGVGHGGNRGSHGRIRVENELCTFIQQTVERMRERKEYRDETVRTFDPSDFVARAEELEGVPEGAVDIVMPILRGIGVVELNVWTIISNIITIDIIFPLISVYRNLQVNLCGCPCPPRDWRRSSSPSWMGNCQIKTMRTTRTGRFSHTSLLPI